MRTSTAALALVLLATGCNSAHAETSRPRVIIVGDSITTVIAPALAAGLPDKLAMRFGIGPVKSKLVPLLRSVATCNNETVDCAPVRALIIEAGTDDALWYVRDWRPDFDAIMAVAKVAPCTIFVNVATPIPDYFGWRNHGTGRPILTVAKQWNAALASAIDDDPAFHLIDWNDAVAADPALLAADEIHPSATGKVWFVDQYREALASCA